MASKVAPAVFDWLIDYAHALTDGDIEMNKPLVDTSPIINFCENFFVQFFENELHTTMTAIDKHSKEAAAEIRLEMPEGDATASVRGLLALFEELCDEWPEILGTNYDFVREDLLEFHESFLPDLLDGIQEWIATLGDPDLHNAAAAASAEYRDAIGAFLKSSGGKR